MEPERRDSDPAVEAEAPRPEPRSYAVASHDVLFAPADVPACDSCGAPLPSGEDDDGGYAVPGEGIYVWTRGPERRFEKAPLCADCAAAIGVTALTRWEIEEEEG
jgi:hypothetical protein